MSAKKDNEEARCGYFTMQKMLENMTDEERKEWEENLEREVKEAQKKQPKGYNGPTFL